MKDLDNYVYRPNASKPNSTTDTEIKPPITEPIVLSLKENNKIESIEIKPKEDNTVPKKERRRRRATKDKNNQTIKQKRKYVKTSKKVNNPVKYYEESDINNKVICVFIKGRIKTRR